MTKIVVPFVCAVLVQLPASGQGYPVVEEHHQNLSMNTRGMPLERHPEIYNERWAEDELLVKFKPGVPRATSEGLHRIIGSERIKEFPSLRLHVVRLPRRMMVGDAIRRYQTHPSVEYAEPNYVLTIQATPNDPRFNDLWGLHNTGQTGGAIDADIDAPEAWGIATGSSSVVVTVIDTGIDYTHPDLSANLWVNSTEIDGNGVDDDGNGYVDDVYGINTISSGGDPWDDHGHGTHVSGTIGAAGNNGIGVVGVNWTVRIMACKFLDAYGSGNVSGAIECLQYVKQMRDRGQNVVATSNSWGGTEYSQALYDAINAQREILFFAAAGNNSQNNDNIAFYPASCDVPNLVAVSASNHMDVPAWSSNYGKGTVQVAAPGESILSTLPDANYWNIPGGYGFLSGTSMATPHVSGLAALLKAADPSRDWRAIKNLILSGSDALPAFESKTITGRRVNALGSVSCSNRNLLSFVRPPLSVEIGTPVTLQALSINCGLSAGPVTVTTSQGETFALLDDGVLPDAAEEDGIFSGRWTPLRDPERLVFSSPAGMATLRVPPPYIGHYLAEGNTKAPYRQSLTAMGAKTPYTWALVTGALPPGLVLDPATGEISGWPTATGAFSFTVQLSDAWGLNLTRAMSLRVGIGDIKEEFGRTLHEGSGANGRGIALDGSGNIHVLGTLNGKNYLAKYSASATMVWLKRYETGYLRAIAVDSAGCIYVAGGTSDWWSGDTLLIKFDPSGNELWERTYDNGQYTDVALDVALDGNGNIFLGGVGDSGIYYMYAEKLDASGNPLWIQTFSAGVVDYGYAIDVDGAGNSLLGGSSAHQVPNPFGGYDYIYDFMIRKYDSLGNLVWVRTYDTGSRYDFLSDLKVDRSGNAYAIGDPEEAVYNASVTLKFSAAGDLVWVRNYQLISHQPNALAVDRQGNVYVTGGSWGEAGGGDWDYLILKYDGAGNLLWKKVTEGGYYFSNYDGDFAYGIDVDATGSVYVTGASFNGIDGYDMLMVKYSGLAGPGEASSAQDMTAERGAGATEVSVHYTPGCGAVDHVIVWGTSPISGGVSWTNIVCARGTSGETSFDPGPVSLGSVVYFVVVAQNASNEGSYGRDSAGVERSEAVGLGVCDLPRSLEGCSGSAMP